MISATKLEKESASADLRLKLGACEVNSLPEPSLKVPGNSLHDMREYFTDDVKAAFVVACISLTLSPALAVASGFPAVSGIYAAIFANLSLAIAKKAYNVIGGPAAGLVGVLTASIAMYGGDAHAVNLVSASIMLVAVMQAFAAWKKLSKYIGIFPMAVIEGMMTGIGLSITLKVIPYIVGGKYSKEAHHTWELMAEIPVVIWNSSPAALWIAGITFAAMLARIFSKNIHINKLPSQVYGLISGTIAALAFGLDSKYLLSVSAKPFSELAVYPDFAGLWSMLFTSPQIVVYVVVAIFLVDTVETGVTVEGADEKDKYGRRSNVHRVLWAMSGANFASGGVGATTNIPGMVKTTANILAGGKTIFVNLYVAIILFGTLCIAQWWFNIFGLLPYPALGVVLAYTGFQLFRGKIWHHMWSRGSKQFQAFLFAAVLTFCFDLLLGVFVGLLLIIYFNAHKLWEINNNLKHKENIPQDYVCPPITTGIWDNIKALFRNPVAVRELSQNNIILCGPITNCNAYILDSVLDKHNPLDNISLDFTRVPFVDPTAVTRLKKLQKSYPNLQTVGFVALSRETEQDVKYQYNNSYMVD